MAPLSAYAEPIVRVSIEPQRVTQISRLSEGLRLLAQADPCVDLAVTVSNFLIFDCFTCVLIAVLRRACTLRCR